MATTFGAAASAAICVDGPSVTDAASCGWTPTVADSIVVLRRQRHGRVVGREGAAGADRHHRARRRPARARASTASRSASKSMSR